MTAQPFDLPSQADQCPWRGALLVLALVLALLGCTAPPQRSEVTEPGEMGADQDGTWAGKAIGARPTPQPALRQALLTLADQEWGYFGQQRVVYTAGEESIPHVGLWEDDDYARISRVNQYWRAVGKPSLTGRQCQEPWSAAFISWLMLQAGVPEPQFRPASAHWVYLSKLIEDSGAPGRYFVPRSISAYRPQTGDLICASEEIPRGSALAGRVMPWSLEGTRTHCDLVVKTDGQTLEAIGGNVRNSVSKSVLELDPEGHLQPVVRRPWFIVIENRL